MLKIAIISRDTAKWNKRANKFIKNNNDNNDYDDNDDDDDDENNNNNLDPKTEPINHHY